MKEQTMKETTLKVKNQTTTLQKAIILGDIVFMIGSWTSCKACRRCCCYQGRCRYRNRNEGKEGAEKWKIVLLVFLFLTGGPVNSLLGLGNVSLFNTFLSKNKASKKEAVETNEEEIINNSSEVESAVKEKSVKKSETKKTDPKKEVDLWLNHFAYQTINRFIMEADASGWDFLQGNTSGKVEGYGEEDGELKKMYEDTIERLPDSKFFPYVCSEFERLWREVSTDYSDDKFVIQWK